MVLLRKILRTASIIIIIIALLCLFAAAVKEAVTGNQTLGRFSKPLNKFASFPGTVVKVLKSKEIKNIPPTYKMKKDSVEEINNLSHDLYALNSFFNQEKHRWDIRLFNLRNDSVLHEWHITEENYFFSGRQFQNSEPRNCIVLDDKSLIADLDATNNLFRLNKESEVLWTYRDKTVHHAMNLSADGNIWICTEDLRYLIHNPYRYTFYRENFITRIDTETGRVLFEKSLSDILMDNGYSYLIYGMTNNVKDRGKDPFHLNDIEPVLSDGEFWKTGDVFLSLRNRSMIIHYRPATNEVLSILNGPFLNQHDVDIISDTEISIFDNNVSSIGYKTPNRKIDTSLILKEFIYSGIVIFNFKDSSYSSYLQDKFVAENIFTRTQGQHQILTSGDAFVESQNNGMIYLLSEKEVVLRKYFSTSIDNMAEQPHWVRIYEDVNFW